MGDRIEKLKGISASTWNRVKTFGPWIIAHSQTLSENWASHQHRLADVRVDEAQKMSEVKVREEARMAEVELVKDFAREQASEFVESRKALIKKMVDAKPEERARLQQDIEFVERQTRQLSIAMKSFRYGESNTSSNDDDSEIEDHWVDAFNDLARRRNEDWRDTLLARALSQESESPGTVSPRALWAIGNLEKEAFEAFSELLNICIWPIGNSSAFLPSKPTSAYKRLTAEGSLVGHVTFLLGDSGFLASGSHKPLNPGSISLWRHGDIMIQVIPKKPIQAKGILLTPLGASIASFCKREWTNEGTTILAEWKDSFDEEEATIGFVNSMNIPDDV